MKLQELVSDIQNDIIDTQGEKNVIVKGIASDSRKVSEGFIFIATRGVQSDGHDFIGKAIELGAKVIVYETEPADLTPGITYIKVKDSADAVGKIASAWFGHPSQQLNLVGVTGTNGKTTTATLLYKMFLQLGFGAGLLSTVCNYVNETEYPSTHTTPDPISLNEFLAKMVE